MSMKTDFIKDISLISNFDDLISNINSIRIKLSAGQGVGKLFELGFVSIVNKFSNYSAFQMSLYNSKISSDVIISEKCVLDATEFQKLLNKNKTTSQFIKAFSDKTGKDCFGLSLKNYVESECQLTTDYNIRTMLNETFGQEVDKSYKDVEFFVNYIKNKFDDDSIIAVSTDNESFKYNMRFINGETIQNLNINTIKCVLPKCRRKGSEAHIRFNFQSDENIIFHSKYGGKTANAFQRGVWVDDINAFTSFRIGKLKNSNAGNMLESLLITPC